MKFFRRGRHRATRYSITVADIERALLAELYALQRGQL